MPSQTFFSRPLSVFFFATLCTMLWGSAYPAIKTGYLLLAIDKQDIPSQMIFAGQRFFLAGVILLAIALVTRRPKAHFSLNQWKQIATLGLTQTCFQYIFFYIGVAYASGVKASILNATGTFFSVILAHFIYKNERITQRKFMGCFVGFAGVFIVNFNQSLFDFQFSLHGEGAVMFAAFILAAASIYGKKISQGIDAMQMTAWQLAIGGLVLFIIGLIAGGKSGEYTIHSFMLLIYLALLSSAAFALWSVLLKHNPVGTVTIFNFLIPVFGSLLSALFLGETILAWKNLIALVCVCCGIYLVTRTKKSPAI